MGLGEWLRKLAGRDRDEDQGVIVVYLRCTSCGEKLRLRIDPQAQLSQDYERGGYFVRKVAIGRRCYRPVEVQLQFDQSYRQVSYEVTGGELLTREEYEAT